MTSPKIVLMVVAALSLFALGGLAALTWLVHGKTPGDQLAIIAGPMGVALGALASVLVSTRTADAPQQVTGPSGGPVPTVEVETAPKPPAGGRASR